MKMVTLAERDLKIVFVVVVICPADTYPPSSICAWKTYGEVEYLHPIDVDIMYSGSGSTKKLNFLADVNTLPGQLFSEPPHIISAEVLILEYQFNVFCTTFLRVNLTIEGNLLCVMSEK